MTSVASCWQRTLVSSLLVAQPVRKDPNEHHSRTASGTGRTCENRQWNLVLCGHFLPPTQHWRGTAPGAQRLSVVFFSAGEHTPTLFALPIDDMRVRQIACRSGAQDALSGRVSGRTGSFALAAMRRASQRVSSLSEIAAIVVAAASKTPPAAAPAEGSPTRK